MYSLFGSLHMEHNPYNPWNITHRLHTKATDNNTMDVQSNLIWKKLTSKQETLRTERSSGENSRLGNNIKKIKIPL